MHSRLTIIKKTENADGALQIAEKLPEFFDAGGLKSIANDSKTQTLYGAFDGETMIGFAIYKEINKDAVEMSWLGVLPEEQGKGVGAKLVEESLHELAEHYKVCEVKTLSDTDPYEPYKKTREFYKRMNFTPIETISPYPGWGDNPCQIFAIDMVAEVKIIQSSRHHSRP